MGFLKKLTVAFALAAGSQTLAIPANADTIQTPPAPAAKTVGKASVLPPNNHFLPGPSEKIGNTATEQKDLQAQYCTEFRQAQSDEYTRFLTHSCFVDFNDEKLQIFNTKRFFGETELLRRIDPHNKAGLFINIDEAKIGSKWDLTPVLGLGIKF